MRICECLCVGMCWCVFSIICAFLCLCKFACASVCLNARFVRWCFCERLCV